MLFFPLYNAKPRPPLLSKTTLETFRGHRNISFMYVFHGAFSMGPI